MTAWADPGFPVGGGADPRGGGAPTYNFAKFCKKLHEIEKNLGRRGARAGHAPPKSATGQPEWVAHPFLPVNGTESLGVNEP